MNERVKIIYSDSQFQSIYDSFAPLSWLAKLFGFSPANHTQNFKIWKTYHKFLVFVYIYLVVFIFRNLTPEIYVGEVFKGIRNYVRIGNSICLMIFVMVSCLMVISTLVYCNKVRKFFLNVADIDKTLKQISYRIQYKQRFFNQILSIVCIVVALIFLNLCAFITAETEGKFQGLNYLIIAVYVAGSTSYAIYMTLFSSYISELTVRFEMINLALNR